MPLEARGQRALEPTDAPTAGTQEFRDSGSTERGSRVADEQVADAESAEGVEGGGIRADVDRDRIGMECEQRNSDLSVTITWMSGARIRRVRNRSTILRLTTCGRPAYAGAPPGRPGRAAREGSFPREKIRFETLGNALCTSSLRNRSNGAGGRHLRARDTG